MIKITRKDLLITDIKKTPLGCSDVLIFIKDIDREFFPSLSLKVDLTLWSKKIFDKSYILIVTDSNKSKILALLSFYCNDYKNSYSYIPLVGVLKDYRKLGLAKAMFKECFTILKKDNFKTLGIKTWKGSLAYNIYSSLGFKEVFKKNSKLNKNISIYLEKKL